jgi:hypothetical protein
MTRPRSGAGLGRRDPRKPGGRTRFSVLRPLRIQAWRDDEATCAYHSALELEPALASRSLIARRLRELGGDGQS